MGLIENLKQRIESIKNRNLIEKQENEQQEIKNLFEMICDELENYRKNYYKEALKMKEHTHFKTIAVQNKINELIDINPNVLIFQDWTGENIGMMSAKLRLKDIVERALDDEVASIQQDDYGINVGMCAINNNLEDLGLKALDNPIARVQKDYFGQNMGMHAADKEMIKLVMKALDDPVGSIQQDNSGCNLGMICVISYENPEMMKCALKAFDNFEAAVQKDQYGCNMLMLAVKHNVDELVLKGFENQAARNQTSNIGYSSYDYVGYSFLKYSTKDKVEEYRIKDMCENYILPEKYAKKYESENTIGE